MITPLQPTLLLLLLLKLAASLPLWSLEEEGVRLKRSFVAKNFVEAMDFINNVATLAEKEGHHPDLHVTSYR